MESLMIFLAIIMLIIVLLKLNQLSDKMDSWGQVLHSQKEELKNLSALFQKLKTAPEQNVATEILPEQEETKTQEEPTLELFTEQEEEKAPIAEQNVSQPESVKKEEIAHPVAVSTNTAKNTAAADSPVEAEKKNNVSNGFTYWFGKFFGENWLTKVGVITLVLGIAFFVKYAIDQDWINETGRVGIGILTGGIIIGIAYKLHNKYRLFAALLTGGGIAVFYITITIAFREYHLFSQGVAFALLIVITVFSVVLSLWYNHRELAVFSLLGGFAAPLLASTGTGNYVVLFLYILILNAGMLVVSFRKRWQIIGWICYVLTILFYAVWLLESYKQQYQGATVFAALFFVQFYALALIDHFKFDKQITAFQVVIIISINLFLLLSCIYIFHDYPYNVSGLISISIAIANAIVLPAVFRNPNVDKRLVYLILAIVATLVTLAVPVQLHGHVITLFWAAETTILLWLWQKSRIRLLHAGFFIVSGLVLISYIADLFEYYDGTVPLRIILNPVCVTGIVVTACFAADVYLFRKEKQNVIVSKMYSVLLTVLLFAVPAFELNYQLVRFTDISYFTSFRYVAMATYFCLYGLALTIIYAKRMKERQLYLYCMLAGIVFYILIYQPLTIGLRDDIFVAGAYPVHYFWIHLLSLPAVIYVSYLLVRHLKDLPVSRFQFIGWALTVLVFIIISFEADHLAVLVLASKTNYNAVLYKTHTFGYPILWGVGAMILMIWGLKSKEVLLRKIALVFFGIIIVKFYTYDVWHTSQAGRIVSFVLLGVILLLVSFLQQKIKILVKKDEENLE